MSKVKRLYYCQFLLVSQINYTLTHFADHTEQFNHDRAKQYLERDKITPRLVWENMQAQVVTSPHGYVVFDDTVLDKQYAREIEVVRKQYSGNEHRVIRGIGIGVMTYVSVNPELEQFGIIDYRIYDPDRDGKSKLNHVRDMVLNVIHDKQLPFRAVLMDTWYAERKLMLWIERLGKLYYCLLKSNRLVDESEGTQPYTRIETLKWDTTEKQHGKTIHIKDFPKGHRVKLFRLVLSSERTDYVATNDMAQDDTAATQKVCGCRWKVEQFHREGKQVTGSSAVSVAKPASNGIIWDARCWCGCA